MPANTEEYILHLILKCYTHVGVWNGYGASPMVMWLNSCQNVRGFSANKKEENRRCWTQGTKQWCQARRLAAARRKKVRTIWVRNFYEDISSGGPDLNYT